MTKEKLKELIVKYVKDCLDLFCVSNESQLSNGIRYKWVSQRFARAAYKFGGLTELIEELTNEERLDICLVTSSSANKSPVQYILLGKNSLTEREKLEKYLKELLSIEPKAYEDALELIKSNLNTEEIAEEIGNRMKIGVYNFDKFTKDNSNNT